MFIRTLTLLALTLLCSASTFAQTQPKAGTATITGRVTLKGEPAASVAISLQKLNQISFPDPTNLHRARTDDEGRFRFTGLNSGHYSISALAPGLIAPSDKPYEPGVALSLADGETIENLELPLKQGGVIAGRITDAQGNPVIEILVRLTKMDSSGKFISYSAPDLFNYSRTDDLGTYRLFALPAGKYKVSVGEAPQPGGLQPSSGRRNYIPQTFHPATPNEAQAKIIEVSEGSETASADIKVGAAKDVFDVAGKVVDAETGQPLAGAKMAFGTPSGNGRVNAWATNDVFTNTRGEFEFPGLMPGKYVAFVSTAADRIVEHYSEPTPFEINNANVSGLEIKAIRGVSISGTVVIEGEADPTIQSKLSQLAISVFPMSREAAPISRSARVSANGTFRISGIPPGKMSVNLFPRLPGLALHRIEHNGALVKDGLDIQSGESVNNIRLALVPATGVLRGQVKFVGGSLPNGLSYRVTVVRVGGTSSTGSGGSVDPRGQFLVSDLAAGEYEVKVLPLLSSTPTAEMTAAMNLLRQFSHRVSVAGSGETQTEFVIDLSKKENDK